jgi:hypothetical protein
MPRTIETSGLLKKNSSIQKFTCPLFLTLALGAILAWASTDDPCRAARNAPSRVKDAGGPACVVKYCRPASGIEIWGRFAGPGDWFYRTTGDFCYFDPRPILP